MNRHHVESTSFEKSIAIELAANRLLTRALVVYLIANDPQKATTTIKSLLAAIDAMANSAALANELDPSIHSAATALIRKRASSFLAELGLSSLPPEVRAAARQVEPAA